MSNGKRPLFPIVRADRWHCCGHGGTGDTAIHGNGASEDEPYFFMMAADDKSSTVGKSRLYREGKQKEMMHCFASGDSND
jgi:hypothetical protein